MGVEYVRVYGFLNVFDCVVIGEAVDIVALEQSVGGGPVCLAVLDAVCIPPVCVGKVVE